MEESPRGYLSMTVIEASGKNKDDVQVWDDTESPHYVKVELRGGSRNIKVATHRMAMQGTNLFWNELLVLPVLDQANELRVMLCKDKYTALPDGGTKRGTQVVAACGIYVSDILDAVPIDKYFELFKPGAGGEGGFIRLGLDYGSEPPELIQEEEAQAGSKKKRRGLRVFLFLLFTAAAAAGGIYGKRWYDEHKEKDKGKVAGKKEEPKRVEPKKDGKKRW